jgi:V/A-type H+-transporting ATPase subunit I
MGLATIERVEILAHASLKMTLLAALQETGILQLEEVRREDLGLSVSPAELTALDHILHRLKHGLDFLSRWEEKGFLDKIVAQKPALSADAREDLLRFSYLPVLEEIEKSEARRGDQLSHARFLEKEVEFVQPLAGLELPLTHFKSSNQVEIMLGTLPLARKDDFSALVEKNAAWSELVREEKRQAIFLLLILKKDRKMIEERLQELQFSPIFLAEPILARAAGNDRVRDIIEKIRREIEASREAIKALETEAAKLFVHREKLGQLYDIFYNERERLASSRLLGETEKVNFLEGWVRAADVPRLRRVLAPYADAVELYLRPPLPEEEPPVVLENPALARPFEVITRLYGLPQRGSIDPTLPLAPFFFIFVGLCLSEAGYGAIIALMSLIYMKFAKPKGNALLFVKLLFLLGISNIILGTLVGGWFGFPIRRLLLIDPLKDPMKFIILALVLGFIQVWLGTLLNMIGALRRKDYIQSILVQGGWMLLVPSLIVFSLTKNNVAGVLSLLGASGVVFFAAPKKNLFARFFGGLYSLYDISKYVGDILSYTRLFALGLSTSVIAMVVNTLAQTARGIPWIGWLVAGLVFLGGHLFNLAISFLGAFVHSMRLQFVEFFTRFFQPGGKAFRPFRMEGKFIDFA